MTHPHTFVDCAGCGAPDAQMYYRPEGEAEPLCPACTRSAALIDAAYSDLHAQLVPVLQAWATRWAGLGVNPVDLGGILWTEGAHWHPQGNRGRPGHAETNAAAFVRELIEQD